MSSKKKASDFKVGDHVWAKMKGFPPWPGLVSEPTKELLKTPKKGYCCIFFFGTNNYGWIEPACIWPYAELKDKVSSKSSRALDEAREAIEEHIKKGKGPAAKSTVDDAFDKLLSPPATPKPTKGKKKDASPAVADGKSSLPPEKSSRKSAGPKSLSPKKPKKRASVQESPSVNGETSVKRKKKSSSDITSVNSIQPPRSLSPSAPGSPDRSVRESSTESNEAHSDHNEITSIGTSKMLGEVSASQASITVGVIGLGVIGSRICKHLIESGYKVVVWNRSKDKSQKFSEVGVEVARTPADLAESVDIILSCVSNPQAAQEVVINPDNGLICADLRNKCYVEMATIDLDATRDLEDAVVRGGGRYLEAQVQGSLEEADNRELVLVCGGSRSAFDFCLPLFEVFSAQSFFVGETGKAVEINLLLQMFRGVSLGGLAEGMALADSANHKTQDLKEILSLTEIYSPFMERNLKSIIEGSFSPNIALKHLQKDIQLGLLLGNGAEHPLPLTASANEVYKHAKRLGYRDADVSAVYLRARF